LRLRGLHIMNDDPTQAHVVYLGGDESYLGEPTAAGSSMQGLVSSTAPAAIRLIISLLNDAFSKAGFALEKDVARNSKIHATVVNSKWRRDDETRMSFDASALLQLFSQFTTPAVTVDCVELCELTGAATSTGTYPTVSAVTLT